MQAALFAGFGVYRRVKKKKWVFWTYRPRVFFVFDSTCCSFFSIPARIRGAFSGVDPRTRIFRRIGSIQTHGGDGLDGHRVSRTHDSENCFTWCARPKLGLRVGPATATPHRNRAYMGLFPPGLGK